MNNNERYELIKSLNIHEFGPFKKEVNSLLEDKSELSDEETFLALEYGGVDNWSGYEYAQELAEEEGEDWHSLSDVDKLSFLESAGVDNWSYYGEAISDYKENYKDNNLSVDDYVEIFEELANTEKIKEWEGYDEWVKGKEKYFA